jgi:hypothetical protein
MSGGLNDAVAIVAECILKGAWFDSRVILGVFFSYVKENKLCITIDTKIRGFLSAQIGVAVVSIFQKFHSK